jgi:hypothetical protein
MRLKLAKIDQKWNFSIFLKKSHSVLRPEKREKDMFENQSILAYFGQFTYILLKKKSRAHLKKSW